MAEPPMELGYEYLQKLRIPAVDSVTVPSKQRPFLAHLDKRIACESLTNDVHELFHFYNWLDLEFEHYQLLLPALRVATLLVQQSALSSWWKHTLYGDLRYDPGKGHYLARSDAELSEGAHDSALPLLNTALPRVLRLGFYPVGSRGYQFDGMNFGSTAAFDQFCEGIQDLQPMVFNDPRIMLHSHYLWDLIYLHSCGSAQDLEQIHLRIAITLVHELAHIVWKYRQCGDVTYTADGTIKEPLHQRTDSIVELGFSWEQFTFGGSIWAIDHPRHMTIYYTPAEVLVDPSAVKTRVVVPRWWVHMWFRKSTWDYFHYLHKSGQLQLPTEAESGYAFRKACSGTCLQWSLYVNGVKQRDLHCMMTEHPAYILWNIIRPRKEEEERIAKSRNGLQKHIASAPKVIPEMKVVSVASEGKRAKMELFRAPEEVEDKHKRLGAVL
ncbi:hypothetical protein BKA66DRAFT_451037 [Pyrenochaeta sp. MPI-SDFR-AT-0127]|nr:hypothetical protein BKA66DRAFT_451037 [Pyrenochaeta sp. MPI-SDFR-AT-0127]